MSPRTGARRRVGSIRLSLILLALVPSVTLAAMWGVTTTQMFTEGLRLRSQTELSRSTGAMGTEAALEAQRTVTDKAVAQLVAQSGTIKKAPSRIRDRMYSVVASVDSLEYYRDQVDNPTDITPQQVLDQYTAIIDDQIQAFQELSQVDDGDLTSQAEPLVALEHGAELVSQEDAQLTLAWHSGHLDDESWEQFAELVHARRWLVEDQIATGFQGATKTKIEHVLQSVEWSTLESTEDAVLRAGTAGKADPDDGTAAGSSCPTSRSSGTPRCPKSPTSTRR